MKSISKVFSRRIKNVLPFLIYSNLTAYVNNRSISESERVISDILEIANTLTLEGFLVTVDIEKAFAFDSVNHCFLSQIFRKFEFSIDFLNWVKTILKNLASLIVGKQQNISIRKRCLKGHLIPAHLFILVLEIFFIFVKNNSKFKSLNIFKHEFFDRGTSKLISRAF